MLYEEKCELGFSNPGQIQNNDDIMFAYNNDDDEYDQDEANYHSYQATQQLAYPEKMKVQESLGFKHQETNDGGLPDYFGDGGGPKPIEIKNQGGKKAA